MKIRVALSFFLTGVVPALLCATGCATAPRRSTVETVSDPGYFLTGRQKGQLIGAGRIQDAGGRWYDIWIVPGYADPARRVVSYARRAGSDLAEYARPAKYRALGRQSHDALSWAYGDCLTDFTLKGVPRAWRSAFSRAHTRTERRVFGWWFAYPWGCLEGLAATAVRVPLGAAGTVAGTAWGLAVVPAYHAADSGVKGAWHLGVDALLLPSAAIAWNTIVAPPMALLGQKPAPSRVDGFWVTMLNPDSLNRQKRAVSAAEIEAQAAWGRRLLAETAAFEARRSQRQEQANAEYHRIRAQTVRDLQAIGDEETRHLRGLAGDRPAGVDPFAGGGLNDAWPHIRARLERRGDLTPADLARIRALLDLDARGSPVATPR